MIRFRFLHCIFSCLFLITPWLAQAGEIDSPAPPDDPAGAMFTLQAIFDRLNDGSVGTKRGVGFVEPTSGPAASASMNLNDIMGVAPLPDLNNGATPAQVLQGRAFWGLDTNAVWGPATGSMANIGQQTITPGTASQGISTGFHDGSGSVSGDASLVTGNIRAGTSIFGVAGTTEVVDTTSGDAVAGDILSDKRAWVDGSEVTGGIPTQTLSAASTTVAGGFYAGTTLTAVDTDLVGTNIRATSTIFGVTGNSNVVNTSTGDAIAGDIATGKKAWVDGVEVMGSLYAGVTCTGMLNGTRWCDNGDGTVTDLTNGLVWLQDAGCVGQAAWTEPFDGSPAGAHTRASNVWDGSTLIAGGDCGLSDFSSEGDWRLPTLKELTVLVGGAEGVLLADQRSFTNVQNFFYWSSSSYADIPGVAQTMLFSGTGTARGLAFKITIYPVWPVRGGQ